MTNKLLCLGMGYVATALATRLAAEGWEIAATCTNAEKQQVLEKEGFVAALLSSDNDLAPSILEGVTHIVSSIPPNEAGDPAAAWLARHTSRLVDVTWAALLSTTGVYGDRDGAWVDEAADLRPTSPRSQRRVDAERQWLSLHQTNGLPAHVFRLAGIYGPGRNPLDRIRSGTAHRIVKPGLKLSRIHRDDIVGILCASIARPNPGAIYNVADDEPAPPQDVVTFGCSLLGVTPPPEEDFATAEMSPMARSFYLDNKRVRNSRLRDELGYVLAYPTYRDGLKALLVDPPQ
ncbi:MAG: SDR family oxidoreductase [Alphaproteobacteria bacterium]